MYRVSFKFRVYLSSLHSLSFFLSYSFNLYKQIVYETHTHTTQINKVISKFCLLHVFIRSLLFLFFLSLRAVVFAVVILLSIVAANSRYRSCL